MARKYTSFSSYLEDVYYNQIFDRIKFYIINNKDRMNLSTYSVPYPSYAELSDFHVMGVTFRELDNDQIEFRASIQAEIEISGKRRKDYESDTADCWFTISFSAVLNNGLHQVKLHDISEYTKERFNAEDSLTKYLVPYVYVKDLDSHAEKFLLKYCPRALNEPMALPIKEILNSMKLTVCLAPLSDDVFGRTYFNDAAVEVFNNTTDRNVIVEEIKPGTILVNPDNFFMRNIGSMNNTIVHECVHWDKHLKFFEMQKLLNHDFSSISCAVIEEHKKGSTDISEELSWMEWQANAIAPRILIPAQTGHKKFLEILNGLNQVFIHLRSACVMELAITEFADFFKVSTTAAKIRAIELGFDQAAGVFNIVDGKRYPSFSFKKGSLKKGQTFIIDRNNAIVEATFNPDLIEDVRAGNFIHAGGMFVINDPMFVTIQEGEEATLTDYALEHVDECCLVFDRTTRINSKYDDSYYRICFLCRDADSKNFVEAKFNPREGKNEDVLKRAREMATIAEEAKRVSEVLANVPSSFCGALDYHINRRGYTNEKVEEHTGISSRMIQDYRNKRDTKPTMQSVLALCIGLNLQPAFSYDLISKAGLNIMISTEEYLVYRYLIDNHHMENIFMWNEKLHDAGIPQQLPKNGNKSTVPDK